MYHTGYYLDSNIICYLGQTLPLSLGVLCMQMLAKHAKYTTQTEYAKLLYIEYDYRWKKKTVMWKSNGLGPLCKIIKIPYYCTL